MEDKVIEGDFTAKPEAETNIENKVEITPVNEFLGRLFEWVRQTVNEYKDFPLADLLNALNTVSLAYLVSVPSVEDQRRYLEWIYKSCMSEIERVAKVKEESKESASKSLHCTE